MWKNWSANESNETKEVDVIWHGRRKEICLFANTKSEIKALEWKIGWVSASNLSTLWPFITDMRQKRTMYAMI